MHLEFERSERVSLRHTNDFNEVWLHDRIDEDTSLLGLGELEVIARERSQYAAGRLDMLLADVENNVRYAVEIMLGPTDPSHIIRCIEYWDIERRRYPAYDHVAVLIAEEVTSRFLNVMALLAGSIPLVAIQVNAIRVGEKVILHFVKVLDQRDLRFDDTIPAGGDDVDRSTWVQRTSAESMAVCDHIVEIINELVEDPVALRYKKRHIGLTSRGISRNIVGLFPRKSWVRMRVMVNDVEQWRQRLEASGLEPNLLQGGARLGLTLPPIGSELYGQQIRPLIAQVVKEYDS